VLFKLQTLQSVESYEKMIMKGECVGIWKDVHDVFQSVPRSSPGKTEESHEEIKQEKRQRDQNSKWAPRKYESRAMPLHQSAR